MSEEKKMNKKQLLKMIEKLKKNPTDKVGILAEVGIGGIGMVAGGAAAAILGSTTASIPIVTALTGFGVVVAAPVALVGGAAVAGGAAAYGITKLIRGSGYNEGKRNELLRSCQDKLNEIDRKERIGNLQDKDKTNFIIFLEEPLKFNLISPKDAQALIAAVENGQMPIKDAYNYVENIINESK